MEAQSSSSSDDSPSSSSPADLPVSSAPEPSSSGKLQDRFPSPWASSMSVTPLSLSVSSGSSLSVGMARPCRGSSDASIPVCLPSCFPSFPPRNTRIHPRIQAERRAPYWGRVRLPPWLPHPALDPWPFFPFCWNKRKKVSPDIDIAGELQSFPSELTLPRSFIRLWRSSY